MKTATVKELKDELKNYSKEELLQLCLRMSKFKKENNLECVHAVWLTDGESSGRVSKYDATKKEYNNFVS